MIKTMCLHQFIRPSIDIKLEGEGNCRKCIIDEKNKECKLYTPLKIFIEEECDPVD
jgi:hypothetical protein